MMCVYKNSLISKVFAVALFQFFLINGFAQTPTKLIDELAFLNQSTNNKIKSKAIELNRFANDILPTIYFKNNSIMPTGEQSSPVRIISDVASINLIYSNQSYFNSIKFICIQINTAEELSTILDLDRLRGFLNLEYIYFLSSVQLCDEALSNTCESNKIKNMLSGTLPSTIKILYTTEIIE